MFILLLFPHSHTAHISISLSCVWLLLLWWWWFTGFNIANIFPSIFSFIYTLIRVTHFLSYSFSHFSQHSRLCSLRLYRSRLCLNNMSLIFHQFPFFHHYLVKQTNVVSPRRFSFFAVSSRRRRTNKTSRRRLSFHILLDNVIDTIYIITPLLDIISSRKY